MRAMVRAEANSRNKVIANKFMAPKESTRIPAARNPIMLPVQADASTSELADMRLSLWTSCGTIALDATTKKVDDMP